MRSQTIALLVIISLLSSVLSTALSSEQIYPSFGKEPKNKKPKETKTTSKPTLKSNNDNKIKEKTTPKKKDKIPAKKDKIPQPTPKTDTTPSDTSTTPSTTDNPAPSSDTSTTPPDTTLTTMPSDTSTPATYNQPTVTTSSPLTSPQPPTVTTSNPPLLLQQPITANPLIPLTPTPSPPANQNSTPSTTTLKPTTDNQNKSLTCNSNNGTCSPITTLKYCPDGYRKAGAGGICELKIHCDASKYNNCPPTICILNKDCPSGFTCSNGYNREGINGDCRLKIPCDSSNIKCPPDPCNVFKGDCKPVRACIYNSTNSTDTSCYPPKNNNDNNKDTSSTDTVIKYYITNSIIKQQIIQQPSNSLIPIDTLQFCNQIGDQACVFANSNMKILFNQTTKDSFGNWLLNGEAQNIGPFIINNVRVTWHLYDALGNVIGLTQGFPTPSNLGIGQTTIFNLQEKPTDLTGIPKFYRVSFDFLS